MNYSCIYDNLIIKAQSLNRVKNKNTYYEEHHIIPKCLGGDESVGNKVLLTAKEHYIAHKLLINIHPGNNSLVFAFWSMVGRTSKNQQRYTASSRDYERTRKEISAIRSAMWKEDNPNNYRSNKGKNNPMYGSQRYGELNPFFGKTHSSESRMKISKNNKGKTGYHTIRKIKVDGIEYNSLTEFGKIFCIPIPTIHKRLNSQNFKNYNYVD